MIEDHIDLNLLLVARGVRPGFLAEANKREVARRIARAGLRGVLVVHSVRVREAPKLRARVVLPASAPAPPPEVTHEGMARLLGLPCGSRQAWEDPELCYGFNVSARPVGRLCNGDDRTLYVTSFWCRSEATGIAWMRRFARRAAAFEREVLRPLGLRWAFFRGGELSFFKKSFFRKSSQKQQAA